MKLKQTVMVILMLLLSLVYSKPAQSSWVGLTTQELIQKSDVILIGDVIGEVGVGKGNPQGIDNYWMTYWKIKVLYYLKGNQESSDFFVVTPGAESTWWSRSSLDFTLGKGGKTVILFLRERDEIFEPLSPQGVRNLDKTDYIRKADEAVNGELILKEFQFKSSNSELEKYISDNSSVIISKNIPSKQKVPNSKLLLILGPVVLILISFVLMALLLSLIVFIFKRFTRK